VVILSSFAYGDLETARKAYHDGDYEKFFSNAENYRNYGALEAQYAFQYRRTDGELVLAAYHAYYTAGYETDELLISIMNLYPSPVGAINKPTAHAEVLVLGGVSPKEVLKNYLLPTLKKSPKDREVHLAIANLGLNNHDRQLAGEYFSKGLKLYPDDPAFLLGMGLSGLKAPNANLPTTPESTPKTYIDLALEQRSNFIPALLAKAQESVNKRDYETARETLETLFQINPNHPEAWALMSLVERFTFNKDASKKAIVKALEVWENNPDVLTLLGSNLCNHYLYKDGIDYLKQATEAAPDSMKTLFSLAQSQVRAGEYSEGWKNMERVHKEDPFNVAAYNQITLRDKIKDYPILKKDGVHVRMSHEDAAIFGQHTLDLAVRSKNVLSKKYGITLPYPVLIEMLPKQRDFAIRTLGVPGGESFLGVCFGPLITMTSPRGRLGRANWESVLWHEMAHTITLHASGNKVPRWLTEGLSVYEEREVREGWGFGMKSEYRSRFLNDKIPNIRDLNKSFTGPDVILGYYHASLVVEYLVAEFGHKIIQDILADLKNDLQVIDSLMKRTQLTEDKMEKKFREFAKSKANGYGENLDWTPLTDQEYQAYSSNPKAWVSENPDRYHGLTLRLSQLISNSEWVLAIEVAEMIINKNPNNRENYNPYSALAQAQRALEDTEGEKETLLRILRLDANLSAASNRLLKLNSNAPSHEKLSSALTVLETNPFLPDAYRAIYESTKESGEIKIATSALKSLIALKPIDTSRLYYDLALIQKEDSPENARRSILMALETNPRFQPALELLSELPTK